MPQPQTHVLIVEDNEENTYYLRTLLTAAGYVTNTARNGAEALNMARDNPPDIIISDLLMPVMDGYTLLRHCKADHELCHIPFVVYTATYTDPEDEKLARELGADAFILKPTDPESFISLLREIYADCSSREPQKLPDTPSDIKEDKELLKSYNQALIRKLEEKMLLLEKTNRRLQRDLVERQQIENDRQQLVHDLGERIKELRTLHEVSKILRDHQQPPQKILQKVVRLLPEGLQYVQAAAAQLTFGEHCYTQGNIQKATATLESNYTTGDGTSGNVIIAYTSEQPPADIGPFLREEQSLIESIAEMLYSYFDRRTALEALRSSEDNFRRTLHDAAIGIAITSLEGDILEANDAYCRMLRYSREEICKLNFRDITHPDDLNENLRHHQLIKLGDLQSYVIEKRYITRDSKIVWVRLSISCQKTPQGQPHRYIAVAEDITERKTSENKLREQAELLDKAQDAILVRDLDHRILYWNKGAERLYKWKAEEVVGKSIQHLIYQEPDSFLAATQVVLSKGEWVGEIQQFDRNGNPLSVEGRWTLVSDEKGNPKSILAINTDITVRKQLESQFLRAQRMESIGTLAGGIAHDLNNLLAPIIMGVDLLRHYTDNPKARPIINTIRESARRGSELVKQVLSFARGVQGERIPIQVSHILHEIEAIIHNTFPKNIILEQNIPQDLPTVIGDPTQINQVILNLCLNARDAMPEGGRLSLTASIAEIDEQYASMDSQQAVAGRYLLIEVADEGVGMTKDLMDRIFEPFFTTKDLCQGTGLGLSTSLGIVRSHSGFINVYSEPSKGSVFKVYLPIHRDAHLTESSFSDRTEDEYPQGQGECILLVDDEVPILNITRHTLQANGYRVITAGDGAQAIALYAQHRDEIDLVLTDMMMPIMDGPTLIIALRSLNPDVIIIAASGLNANSNINKATRTGVSHFLSKPYTTEKLLSVLRSKLDARKARRHTGCDISG